MTGTYNLHPDDWRAIAAALAVARMLLDRLDDVPPDPSRIEHWQSVIAEGERAVQRNTGVTYIGQGLR